jgi:hypothetical protein
MYQFLCCTSYTHKHSQWFINAESRLWFAHDSAWLETYAKPSPTPSPTVLPSPDDGDDDEEEEEEEYSASTQVNRDKKGRDVVLEVCLLCCFSVQI